MERTNKIDPTERRWWIKTEGNYFRLGNKKIIKKGQKFQARLEEIPEAFRDTIKPADGEKIVKEEIPVVPEAKYYIKHRAGKWWDVFDENDKLVNEKALDKEAAEALIESLK